MPLSVLNSQPFSAVDSADFYQHGDGNRNGPRLKVKSLISMPWHFYNTFLSYTKYLIQDKLISDFMCFFNMALTNLFYLSSLSLPLLFVVGCFLKGPWTYLTFVFTFGIIPILEWFFGDHPIFPEIPPVKENSLRDYAYRSIPILFALGHIICLFYGAFAISQSLSWYEIIGLTLSSGALCMFSLTSMTHEPLHKRPIDGKLFSYYYPKFVSALGLVYSGHISIHHNPLISCTEQDFISHGRLHQSLYRYVLFTIFPSKEK